jgi:cytidine deaminase
MKLTKEDKELIKKAFEAVEKARPLKKRNFGGVASALVTSKGNIYFGISLDFDCGIGSCGEAQAIGSMLSNGEKEIETIVAVEREDKLVLPPCGKCREMIYQCDKKNLNAWVIISKSEKVKLKDLLPHRWQELW